MPPSVSIRHAGIVTCPCSPQQGSWLYAVPVTLRAAYRRIADDIAAQITSGTIAVGERLPSRRAMASERGVSVGTIEMAVRVLAGQGLVDTAQGIGVIVISDKPVVTPTTGQRLADIEARLDRIERSLRPGGER